MHPSMAFNFPSLPSIAEEVTRQELNYSEHEYQTIDQESNSSWSCQQILLLPSSVFFGHPAEDQSKSMINRVLANLTILVTGKDSKFICRMIGITCIIGIAFFLGFLCGNPHFLESRQDKEGTFFLDKQYVMNLTRLDNFRQVKVRGIEAMVDLDLVCSPRITLPNSCPHSRANITSNMNDDEPILHYLDGVVADVQLILNTLEAHGMSNGFTAVRVDLKQIASFVQP